MSTSKPLRITHTPNLQLSLGTIEDIEEIRDIWYACFTEPFIQKMFPDVPSVRQWWDDHNLDDMLNKPGTRYLIVKDISKEGGCRSVGYAKWSVPVGDAILDPQNRFPPWCEDGDVELADLLFGTIAQERKELMGDRQYYYLDMLGTIEEYRRLGVGNLLVGWGCQRAGRDGLQCFVDASDAGRPIYERFGFLGQEPFTIPGEDFSCTSYVRPGKKRDST